jgi:hypothetical protein
MAEEPPPIISAPAPPPGRPFTLVLETESSMDTNGQGWFGARAAGCVAAGPVCLGGVVRLSGDSGALSGSSRSRYEWESLLTVGVPLGLGRLRLLPALGAGLGWTHAHDASDPSEAGVDDDRSARVELSLGLSLPIGRGFALAGLLAADASTAGVTVSEGGGVVQPWGYLRLGLGLQWGAPRP